MAWMLCVAVLAAFGMISVLWALLGWLLPGSREGLLLCHGYPGFSESAFFRRYLFLRDLGLLGSTLVVIDEGLSEPERKMLARRGCGVELCPREKLPERLELERNRIDGTGNGNYSGRDQRGGISEL